jgi:hypothetical protein
VGCRLAETVGGDGMAGIARQKATWGDTYLLARQAQSGKTDYNNTV